MSIEYVKPSNRTHGYWSVQNPILDDLYELVEAGGTGKSWYNFVIQGEPDHISPQWLAKHPGYIEGEYDYFASYSIDNESLADLLSLPDMSDEELEELGYDPSKDITVEDIFNLYIEDSGNSWESIYEIRLVNRSDPWENTL